MNYQHIFHAGNTADVVKHCIQVLLLQTFKQKEKGFCYIDTHAGAGYYDLSSVAAKKTGEYQEGIALFSQEPKNTASSVYLQIAREKPGYYPGSPWFAKKLLRSRDKLILNELNPPVCSDLRRLFKFDSTVFIHSRDAHEFLPAIIPPNPRRGLVMMDPSFEDIDEKNAIRHCLEKCFRKWPEGTYMIWLPKKQESLQSFYDSCCKLPAKNIFWIEFYWQPKIISENMLSGCSIVILNTPFGVHESMIELADELTFQLSAIQMRYSFSFMELPVHHAGK